MATLRGHGARYIGDETSLTPSHFDGVVVRH
jgi:hypothetical protein